MGEGTETAPPTESSQAALMGVVKELRNEPPLLFGIGAGILFIGILAATASIAIVLVVAAVFVVSLGVWLLQKTRARVAASGARTHVRADRSEVAETGVLGGIQAPAAGNYETDVTADGAKVAKGANLGGIQIGGSSKREEG